MKTEKWNDIIEAGYRSEIYYPNFVYIYIYGYFHNEK